MVMLLKILKVKPHLGDKKNNSKIDITRASGDRGTNDEMNGMGTVK